MQSENSISIIAFDTQVAIMLTDNFISNQESKSNAFLLFRKRRIENPACYFFISAASDTFNFDNAHCIFARLEKIQSSVVRHRLQKINGKI